MVLSHNYCCGSCLIFFRKLYTCSILRANHYRTLGLSPSASQSEIKSAYYELSKKHHPDKNQGSEKSAKLFRDITAAYEILGNEKLRKKYDESHSWSISNESPNFDYTSPRGDYNDDVERMYYERRQRRFHRRYYYGKTPYYDFDAWYKAHYGKNSYDAESWVKNNYGKNSNPEFEEWYRKKYHRNDRFTFNGPFKTYRQSMEEMKKQESFIKRSENALLIMFYFILIVTLISRV